MLTVLSNQQMRVETLNTSRVHRLPVELRSGTKQGSRGKRLLASDSFLRPKR